MQGNIEKVNRRTLSHLASLSVDLGELGVRYNGFSLSEQSPTVAAAIERIGQAVDSSYIHTEELSSSLGATFAEPMRESAQFAGVVRSVLRFRILKRIQEEMTKDELAKKKALLDSLERSELEAKRIESYLSSTGPPNSPPRRSASASSAKSYSERRREAASEDTASIDSDFPPTHSATGTTPSASQGLPPRSPDPESPAPMHKRSQSGNFVTNNIFGRISHAVHGIVDVDPERTRRDQIGKTKESLVQLEHALEVAEKDVKDASTGVLKDLKRFQKEKEEDIQRYMVRVGPEACSGPSDKTDPRIRLHTRNVTSNGRRRTWRRGRRLEKKSTKSKFGSRAGVQDANPCSSFCAKARSGLLGVAILIVVRPQDLTDGHLRI